MKYAKVRDRKDLIRDMGSKAILQTDLEALNKYREERAAKQRLNQVVNENAQLKREMTEIKRMLQELLARK